MTRPGTFLTLAFILTVVGPTLGSVTARAGEAEDPERLIRQGNDLRRKGDDLRAFGYLQRAHELAKTPRSEIQLGLCEQALGRFADAETHLSHALSSNDAWVDANRANLEASRAIVRGHLGKIQVTGAPPSASIAIGGAPAVKLNPDGTFWVAPGSVTLNVEAPGFRGATRSATVAKGGTATIAVELVPLAAATATATVPAAAPTAPVVAQIGAGESSPAPPTPTMPEARKQPEQSVPIGSAGADDGRSTMRITGLAVAGAGAALAITGFVLRHTASTKIEAIESAANADPPRAYDPANGNWQTYEGLGIGLLAAGGAAVVTGAVIYVVNRGVGAGGGTDQGAAISRTERASTIRLSFAPTPGSGAAVELAGRF